MAKKQMKENYTKADLAAELAARTGLSRIDSLKSIEATFDIISEVMIEGKKNIQLRGHGSYFLKKRAQKKARNISKQTTIIIPAHVIPAWKPSKSFIAKVQANQ